MSSALELALAKQRLQIRSAILRTQLAGDLHTGLAPFAAAAAETRAGIDWLRTHPQWVVGGFCALVALRPRRVWRWGWRVWGGWRLLQPLVARYRSGLPRT